jgi:hypothetical protein
MTSWRSMAITPISKPTAGLPRAGLNPDPPIGLGLRGGTVRGKGALTWENSGCKTRYGPQGKDTFSMSTSHSLDSIDVIFDDERLVADAGLIQPATLAQHLGLRDLFDTYVDLGDAPGHANVGHKAMTVVHSALRGGDSIDDADALRAGSTEAVLGHALRAPSTLSTFLRGFGLKLKQDVVERDVADVRVLDEW